MLPGIDIERVELSTNFGSDLKEIGKALDDVDLKRREAEITQFAKTEAMIELNVLYGAAIRLLEALAILAGKPKLAGRVRPPRRRRSSGENAESTGEEAAAADSNVDSKAGSVDPHRRHDPFPVAGSGDDSRVPLRPPLSRICEILIAVPLPEGGIGKHQNVAAGHQVSTVSVNHGVDVTIARDCR